MTYYFTLSKKTILITLVMVLSVFSAQGQNSVSIGTEEINENAVLQLVSADDNQGLLVPRLSTAQRNAMSLNDDDSGMLVFDTDEGLFYYWTNSNWFALTNNTMINTQDLNDVLIIGNDANNMTISNLADPVNEQDAATRSYVDNNVVPTGSIVMWSGTIAEIPAGWALCDGTNGTPDLRDRFVCSVGTGEEPGSIGGNPTHSHTVADHVHTINPPSTSLSINNTIAAEDVTGLFPKTVHGGGGTVDIGEVTSSVQTTTVTTDEVSHYPPFYELAFIMKL
jgi:hypothetical protein